MCSRTSADTQCTCRLGNAQNATCMHACHTHAACKVQAWLLHAHHTHSICTLHASCKHMIITLCACHTHAAYTWHAHFTNATCMLHVTHMHAYAGHMHAAHTPLYMSYKHHMLVTFTLHAHTKHAIHMSQTCLMHAAHAPHTCHPLCRLNTFQMQTFMHALAYYITCKNTTSLLHVHCMHTQCIRAPRKQHSSCTHATLTCIHRCHICYMRKYAAGIPKTHTVCMLHANYMQHMHACMPHSY